MNPYSRLGASALCLLALASAGSARADTYAVELGKCMVGASTADERNALVRWMFATASGYPAVRDIAAVSPAKIDDANKAMGRLVTRLVAESCHDSAELALKVEGPVAFQTAFQMLGQVAGRDLFTDPSVQANMQAMQQYIDKDKLKAAFSAPAH